MCARSHFSKRETPRAIFRASGRWPRRKNPAPHNSLGAKGAGEGGIIPVGGVMANAVAAALASLAVEPRELPLSPPRVWELIKSGSARALLLRNTFS